LICHAVVEDPKVGGMVVAWAVIACAIVGGGFVESTIIGGTFVGDTVVGCAFVSKALTLAPSSNNNSNTSKLPGHLWWHVLEALLVVHRKYGSLTL